MPQIAYVPHVKRALDLVFATLALAACLPALGLAALAVRFDSAGPALFAQERVGQYGRRFKLWKLRTMVSGASAFGPSVTARGDPRVTRVGRVLRSTKLDELPQLWNVLRGEMSVVGPRPEVAEFVELFQGDYDIILSMPPGVTDEASVLFRREEDLLAEADDPHARYVREILPRKIALARDYVARPSFRRDVAIVARTLSKVVLS